MSGHQNSILDFIRASFQQIAYENIRNNLYDPERDMESAVAIIMRMPSIDHKHQPKSQGHFEKSPSIFHQIESINQELQDFYHSEILFLQRCINEKDYYSGHICFPGGRVAKNESPLEAALRETQQETNIQISQRELLCMVDTKILARNTTKNKKLYTYMFMFQIPHDFAMNIRLNEKEMSNYKWVEMSDFLNEKVFNFHSVKRSEIEAILSKTHQQQYMPSIKEILWPSIDIGLSVSIYGVTYYILIYIMKKIALQLNQKIHLLKNYHHNFRKYQYEKEMGKPKEPKEKLNHSSVEKKSIFALVAQLEMITKFITKFEDHFYDKLIVTFNNVEQKTITTINEIFNNYLSEYFQQMRPKF